MTFDIEDFGAQFSSRPAPAYLDRSNGALVYRADVLPTSALPLSPNYETVDSFRNSLSPEGLQLLLDLPAIAVVPPPFTDEVENAVASFTRNVPEVSEDTADRTSFRRGLRDSIRDQAPLLRLEAEQSFVFREAAQLRIERIGPTYFLANYSDDGPNVLLSTESGDTQDEAIIWSAGFIGEALLGVLACAGIKVKGGNKIGQIIRKLLKNAKVSKVIRDLAAGVTAASLLAFLKVLYDEGLLGDVFVELVEVTFFGFLALLAQLALNFIPGVGQAKLVAGMALLVVELGVKLARKPRFERPGAQPASSTPMGAPATPSSTVDPAGAPAGTPSGTPSGSAPPVDMPGSSPPAGEAPPGPDETSKCCCCVDQVWIDSVRDFDTKDEDTKEVLSFGHAFNFGIKTKFKPGSESGIRDCILEWFERVTYIKPNEPIFVTPWQDLFAAFPETRVFDNFRKMKRPCPAGGEFIVNCPDSPIVTTRERNGRPRTFTRIVEFRLVVKSNKACGCPNSALEAKATQVLVVVDGNEVPGTRSFKVL